MHKRNLGVYYMACIFQFSVCLLIIFCVSQIYCLVEVVRHDSSYALLVHVTHIRLHLGLTLIDISMPLVNLVDVLAQSVFSRLRSNLNLLRQNGRLFRFRPGELPALVKALDVKESPVIIVAVEILIFPIIRAEICFEQGEELGHNARIACQQVREVCWQIPSVA